MPKGVDRINAWMDLSRLSIQSMKDILGKPLVQKIEDYTHIAAANPK